jgi:hypothetical protein
MTPGHLTRTFFLATCFSFAAASVFAGTPAQTLNVPDTGVIVDDESEPEVTDRVARISFLSGAAKLRRADNDEWETATLNLPIVEGDEIVTDAGSRVELQFDNNKHLRLGENAYLKIVNLRYEGIAVSLSLGTMSLRIMSFDKDKAYFEIDAPKTTLAIQRSGTYRIDAGKQGDAEVRVSIRDGGEARIYSENAGFALRSGRSARIYVDGPTAGEWEAADAARFLDDLDTWTTERDAVIAQKLKDSYYDRYYDQDIYGADDLTDYGEWVYRQGYGYAWRPHRTSVSRWSDWSPYRYGHWRWIPPYGWVWINDEPWGWATYHHGRWFYDAGYWYWSPYGYYRPARSWWFPALVVINVVNSNVCWYPLPYHYTYYNYNSYYHRRRRQNQSGHANNPTQAANFPTGGIKSVRDGDLAPTGGIKPIPPKSSLIPASGVVAVGVDDFGSKVRRARTASPTLANVVLTTRDTQPPKLPELTPGKVTREVVAVKPPIDTAPLQTRLGAATRKTGAPLDNELRTTKMLGGREPLVITNPSPVKSMPEGMPEPRKTGAVERAPVIKQPVDQAPVRPAPTYTQPVRVPETRGGETVKPQGYEPPVQNAPPRSTPRYEDPPVRQSPPPVKSDPAPVRQSPPSRNESQPVKPPPTRSEPPPTRSEPAPTKQSPPPARSEPVKPPPSDAPTRKKDGR